MRRVLRRRLPCAQLAVALLLLLSFVQVVWSPLYLGRGQAHAGPARTSPPPRREAEPGGALPSCANLNASAVAGWSPVPSPQLGDSGPYCVVYDWLSAARRPLGNQSVTLCTHATADSAAQHAPLLAAAWAAPVSLAVFVLPGEVDALAVRLAHLRRYPLAPARPPVSSVSCRPGTETWTRRRRYSRLTLLHWWNVFHACSARIQLSVLWTAAR